MAVIHGTNGNDRADLGGQNLVGTNQNDHIYGYGGNDYILGLGGHDTIDAGGGNYNTVFAGDGDDAVLTAGLGGYFDGGAGDDTMIFTTGLSGTFHLGEGWAAFGPNVWDRFTMREFEHLSTGSGNDTIDGSSGRNVISSGAGNDVVRAAGGNDEVFLGAGNDYVDGGDGNDHLRGENGNDELYGGNGNDILDGGNGNDLLWGGHGDDMLRGGRGNDTLDGGNSGFDTADYTGHGAAATVDMTAGKAYSTVGGVAEVDTLFRIDAVTGSSFGDALYAAATTRLDGAGGDDWLASGSGANVMAGGTGNDTASYQSSAAGVQVNLAQGTAQGGWAQGDALSSIENLYGSSFADTLTGNGSANVLTGGAGNDTLNGGAGADRLIGGSGVDMLTGGSGADMFVFQSAGDSTPSLGGDTITDFVKGVDKIDLSTIDANVHVAGNQAFHQITGHDGPGWAPGFTAGSINVSHQFGQTYVHINTSDAANQNGYDAPEMFFRIDGYHDLGLSDFML